MFENLSCDVLQGHHQYIVLCLTMEEPAKSPLCGIAHLAQERGARPQILFESCEI